MQKLYLSKDAKGLGISNLLLGTALNFASKNFTRCYLENSSELRVAQILYEKWGFTLMDKPLSGSIHTAMDLWYTKDFTSSN